MKENFIIDAHAHVGTVGAFFAPQHSGKDLLDLMNRLGIKAAICSDVTTVWEGAHNAGLSLLDNLYKESKGRIYFLGTYNPKYGGKCIDLLNATANWQGFCGLKLHPSIHETFAESADYEPAWKFAAEHDLAILTHSWSVSGYNPVQKYSTPERFEGFVRKFPNVRFVLGHAGGRGLGRLEAVRMAKKYPNVYLDFGGDIFCYRLIESLVESVPPEKILFGSDFPWLSPCVHLSRVLLADIPDSIKQMILGDNAARVYKIKK